MFAIMFILGMLLNACSNQITNPQTLQSQNEVFNEEQLGAQPVVSDSYTVYTDTALGFQINYPKNWEVKKSNISGSEQVMFTFEGNVLVAAGGSLGDAPTTLADFTDFNIKNLRLTTQGFELLESKETTLAGLPAHRIIFNGSPPILTEERKNDWFKRTQIWAIKDNNVYLISFIEEAFVDGERNSFDVSTFENMVDTFKILS